jgi:flagellar biosynthesis/type III secretory pathway chaperone
VSPKAALSQSTLLLTLLDQEFEALRSQNLEAFEALQPQKAQVLADLGAISAPFPAPHEADWLVFLETMSGCKDRHRRNEILLQRKLDAIRSALRTLQGPDPLNSVDVYDRMGRLSGLQSRRGRGEA